MPADEPADEPAAARGADRRWLLIAVVVAVPILVLIAALAQRTWYPTGDQAQAELRMLSLPGHPPLVGAAGRIADEQVRQGNHPGPLMFWVTWPAYKLLGSSSWAFEAATALVNVAWLTLSVWLVKRRAGLGACAWFGGIALVLIGGFGLDALSQPWNPWVALLPFAVLLLSTWGAIEGDRWSPVLAVAAGSYALQGHVGYLPLVLPLVGIALVAPLTRWWRSPKAPAPGADADVDVDVGAGADDRSTPAGRPRAITWALPMGVAVVVALLAWSGPLWDLLTNDPSNVSKIIANFSSPSDPPIGLKAGIEAVFQTTGPFGSWVWGGAAVEGSAWPGKLFLLAWAVVAVLVTIRGERPALSRFNALLAGTLLVATFAVSRIFGSLYLYTFRWIVVIVALQLFTLGWGLATLVPKPSPILQRRLAGAAVIALVVLSGVTAVRISRQEIPYDQSWRSEQALAPVVASKLDPGTRYLVTWDDPAYLGGLGFGLILDLERRGFDVGGQPQYDAAIEPHRVMCSGDFDQVIIVVTGENTIERYRQREGLTEVAATDPREDPEAWDETADELVDVLNAQKEPGADPVTRDSLERSLNLLLLAPGQTQHVVDLASDLVLGGVPSAVFVDERDPATLGPLEAPDLSSTHTSHPC
ncbi:MAG: hypothetical protein JWO77_2908 [Ilumatobacteraceae bacterium]|nr:hypothetical protein [Ilumatobacteraceae bacterium]